jgi:hypothetical protein
VRCFCDSSIPAVARNLMLTPSVLIPHYSVSHLALMENVSTDLSLSNGCSTLLPGHNVLIAVIQDIAYTVTQDIAYTAIPRYSLHRHPRYCLHYHPRYTLHCHPIIAYTVIHSFSSFCHLCFPVCLHHVYISAHPLLTPPAH